MSLLSALFGFSPKPAAQVDPEPPPDTPEPAEPVQEPEQEQEVVGPRVVLMVKPIPVHPKNEKAARAALADIRSDFELTTKS